MEYYEVDGYCTNCDYRGPIKVRKGAPIPTKPEPFPFFTLSPFRFSGIPSMCPVCDNATCYAKR